MTLKKDDSTEKYLAIIWGFFIPLCFYYSKILYTEYLNIHDITYQGKAPDYLAFWAGAKMAASGFATQAFDQASLILVEREAYANFNIWLPWHNPPVFFIYLFPFSLFDFFTSYVLWVLFTTGFCTLVCGKLVKPAQFVLPAIFCTFPYYAAFANGQSSMLMAALWGAVALAFLSKRPFVVGIIIALMLYKPQYGVLIPFAFIAGREWKAFAAATFASIALIGLSLALYGLSAWQGFYEGNVVPFEVLIKNRQVFDDYKIVYSVYGVARFIGGLSYNVAMSLQVITSLLCLALTILTWANKKIPYEIKIGILIFCTILCNFYVYWHDLFIFTIPVLLVFRTKTEANALHRENYIYIGLIFSTFLANAFEGQILFVPITVIGYLLYKRYRYFNAV